MQCTSTSNEHVFSVEAMVRGYHEYQNAWDAPIGKILSCEREVCNIHDTFVVPIKMMVKDRITAGCPYFRSFLSNLKFLSW